MNENTFLKDFGHGIFLTEEDVSILDKYEISYQSCQNLNELILIIYSTFHQSV